MPSKLQRLFVKSKLAASAEVELDFAQAHYLGNVLRLPVVGAQRDSLGAMAQHCRDQIRQVLARRALPDKDPHAFAALFLSLIQPQIADGLKSSRKV